MHALDFTGEEHLQTAGAAFHVDDLNLQAFFGVEAASLRHPHRKYGYDRRRDADLERDRVGGVGARCGQAESEPGCHDAKCAKPHDILHSCLHSCRRLHETGMNSSCTAIEPIFVHSRETGIPGPRTWPKNWVPASA